MMPAIFKFIALIRRSKFKIFLMLLSTVIFFFVLFPVNDLGDLVATQVARLSQNKLFLQFEELQTSFFPTPGMKVKQVYVETPAIPPVSVQELKFTPSISGLIAQQPYGTVNAKGLFGGEMTITVKSGTKSDNGVARQKVEIAGNRLSLQSLRELGNLPIMLKGKLDINSTALIDPAFGEQPDVELTVNIQQFELPPSNLATEMGDVQLPEIKVSKIDLKGRLAAGKMIIDTGSIGKDGDDVQGTVTGNLGLTFARNEFNPSGPVQPVLGAYSFNVDLKPSRKFQERASLMLSILDQYKVLAADGVHYKLKVAGENFRGTPAMSPLR